MITTVSAESSRMAQITQVQPQQCLPVTPATDELSLPIPPVAVYLSVRKGGSPDGHLQRYLRRGDNRDATSAVIGKGGFGTAYRFIRDDSFTPPSSQPETAYSGDTRQLNSSEEESIEALRRTPSERDIDTSNHLLTEGALKVLYDNRAAVESHQHPKFTTPNQRDLIPKRAPAVIVIKVCRTPTSGSYDELPKTGKGREEAKIAAHELAEGNPTGEHTRIVRGEARLLRFLQIAQSLKGKNRSPSYLVKLLADVPMPKQDNSLGDEEEDETGPPIPRLLSFERLVDLDSEMSAKGWVKNKRFWTVEKVEMVSRDVVAGLRFLHEHHIVHGDLKPSNFMRDPKTGVVKLIDLGASRRWVRLPNVAKERTSAVEELDQAYKEGLATIPKIGEVLCEGLGSLTGSPHFMAPEVLLQAGRYLSADGHAKSILDDYLMDRSYLPKVPSASLLEPAYRDFKRGWGIKADVWSWGCSVISLLLRTIPSDRRPSSNSICAFDFSFEEEEDSLYPAWPLHISNESLPRFHQWARMYPLRIMSVLQGGVKLPEITSAFSKPMVRILQAVFQQQDHRPPAHIILQYLDTNLTHATKVQPRVKIAKMSAESCSSSNGSTAANSLDMYQKPSLTRSSTSTPSNPDEAHNVDLSDSVAMSASQSVTGQEGMGRHNGSSQNFVMLGPAPKRNDYLTASPVSMTPKALTTKPTMGHAQPKYLQNRLVHSSLASPSCLSSPLPTVSPSPTTSKRLTRAQTVQRAATSAAECTPPPQTITLPSPSFQPLTSSPMIRSSGSVSRPIYSQRSLSLADEVFMNAYEQERKKMSPVSPLVPTVQVRQLDSMPSLDHRHPSQLQQNSPYLSNNGDGEKREIPSLQEWDQGMGVDRTLRYVNVSIAEARLAL
ncbi:hypothetical protein CBS101457_005761 [Exobasidium rhododendri]|nr:hypothetical protein CBS101457_005761 [Exobasidium rhododendri]